MERATHSAILERRGKNKINKSKHLFRQALSRSFFSWGSMRLVEHSCALLSSMREYNAVALPRWLVFQQCACLVKLYCISVLSSLKDKNTYCWANLICFWAHHSRLLCIQWREIETPRRWFANFALGVWNCLNELRIKMPFISTTVFRYELWCLWRSWCLCYALWL